MLYEKTYPTPREVEIKIVETDTGITRIFKFTALSKRLHTGFLGIGKLKEELLVKDFQNA